LWQRRGVGHNGQPVVHNLALLADIAL